MVLVFALNFWSCYHLEGKRYSLPNSRIMIHQPLGGAQGGQSDIEIQVITHSTVCHSFACQNLWPLKSIYQSAQGAYGRLCPTKNA